MGDHVDAFCPECGANVGPGTVNGVGCPLCGYSEKDGVKDIILRVSRHEATESHVYSLRHAFGEDFEIITQDIAYGDNPVLAVQAVIDSLEVDLTAVAGRVIAVEAAGPDQVLQALVEGLNIPIIRPVFRRESGRAVAVGKDSTGRDIFDVERYERLGVEVRPALVGKPL